MPVVHARAPARLNPSLTPVLTRIKNSERSTTRLRRLRLSRRHAGRRPSTSLILAGVAGALGAGAVRVAAGVAGAGGQVHERLGSALQRFGDVLERRFGRVAAYHELAERLHGGSAPL